MSDGKKYITYNHVHQLCQEAAVRIDRDFHPDFIVAIGGGGFIPARILRTHYPCKVFAIILSLYENTSEQTGSSVGQEEKPGIEVVRTQWIDYEQCKLDLVGKNVLIVDEVDDTRTTLHYALSELEKDAEEQSKAKGVPNTTKFGIFVLHDKVKPKKADLPAEIVNDPKRYFAARTVGDDWLVYPWESRDIVYHTERAMEQDNDVFLPSDTKQ